MPRWLKEGKVTPHEWRFDGLDSWPTAFRSLFVGTEAGDGKVVVMLKDADFEGERIQSR
jgi:NADPH-dependent curcumin reductase CurA